MWRNGFLFLPVLMVSLLPTLVKAQENRQPFSTTIDTKISVSRLGLAQFQHTIALANNEPTRYATKFALQISSGNLDNIQVLVNGEPNTPNLVASQRDTSIGIDLPEKVLGQDQQNTIVISYANPDATVVTGHTLSVFSPKLADPTKNIKHQITLETDPYFGELSLAHPEPKEIRKSEVAMAAIFPDVASGMTAFFGNEQNYTVNLAETISNDSTNSRLIQVALPPDTTYQQVFYESLNPQPEKFTSDLDGNWIATYLVEPNQQQTIQANLSVQRTIAPNQIAQLPPAREHLSTSGEWSTPRSYQGGENVFEIYNHVVDKLQFNYEKDSYASRMGAGPALENPQDARAEEFVDAFVGLARRKGVPSRRVIGYAYSENSGLRPLSLHNNLHVWAEYFQNDAWHPADPTWEHTTGGVRQINQPDFHHLTFAYQGASANSPKPLGLAETETDSATVEVVFSDNFPKQDQKLNVTMRPKLYLGMPIPGLYVMKLENQSGSAIHQHQLNISAQQYAVSYSQLEFDVLLPFQTHEIPVRVTNPTLFKIEPTQLQLHANNQNYTFAINSGPQFVRVIDLPGYVFTWLAVLATLGALGAGSLLVFRRKR